MSRKSKSEYIAEKRRAYGNAEKTLWGPRKAQRRERAKCHKGCRDE